MTALISIIMLLAQVVGSEFTYTAQPGDSFTLIGARFGVDVRVLAEANGLKPSDRLQAGQSLRVNNRHIVPQNQGATIMINVPQRMLFYFEETGASCAAAPVAAGKPDWKTPLGDFEIIQMEEKPTWDVPVSIQEEMRRAGKTVLTRVPPSPENPLGEYWIGLSLPGIGIHGTNAPSSIYKLTTHGCIRLHPDDVRNLFATVDTGTRGRIIYEPILIVRDGNAIWLEVHPDSYKRQPDPLRKVLDIARSEGFLDMLDLAIVKQVIQKRDGIARDVTRR